MKTLCRDERMTSKERVRAAFTMHESDRVPVDYSANPGIDGRLKAWFGLEAGDWEGLNRALGVDFRYVNPPYTGPRLHEDVPGRNVNPQWGIRTRYIEHGSGGYWDFCDFPLREADVDAVAAWPMPSPDDHDYGSVPGQCARYGGYATVTTTGFGDIINGNGMLRSMEQVFMDLITDDPAGMLLTRRRLDYQYTVLCRTLEAAAGGIDIVYLGEDLGTQIAPIISMDIFRRHIRPEYERMCGVAHAHGALVMMHTCGSSSWAYEDFIEMGIHIVETLQPEAVNMAPAYLRQHFGGRLAFHGCISTGGPIANGTVDDVVANVRETLAVMMPGGGYCLAPSHALQDNSPTENVVAMYEAAHTYGRY